MSSVCILPFTRNEFSIVMSMKEHHDSIKVVSPEGIGKEGDDISILRNLPPIGIEFSNKADWAMEISEVIIITDIDPMKKSLYQYAYTALKKAIVLSKRILCFLKISAYECEKFAEICKRNGGHIEFFNVTTCNIQFRENIHLFSFDEPIIFVGEAIPDCDGYDVFLNIALQFENRGKRVLAISEDSYNPLFGFTTISFDEEVTLKEQVFRINAFIHELERVQKPDVILIRLPQPMIKFSELSPFDSGLTAYAISQAVPGDECVFCSYSNSFDPDFWNSFSELVESKFGYPIMKVCVSNRTIDNSSDSPLASLRLPSEMVAREVEKLNQVKPNFFFQLFENEIKELVDEIINSYFELPYGVI